MFPLKKLFPPLVLIILLALSCVTASLIVSCSKSPASAVVTTPTPAHPPSEHHRLAPEGTLYLIQRTSLTTDTGVIGFPPGTKVKFVEERGGTLVVTDGTVKFEVSGDLVTNDLDIAQMAAHYDAQSQRALGNYMRRQGEIDRQNQDKLNTLYDHQQREVEARRVAAAVNAKGTNKLDREAYHQVTSPYYGYYHPWTYYYRAYPYQRP